MEEAMYRYVINVYVAVYVYIHGIVAKAKYDFFSSKNKIHLILPFV